MQQAWPTDCHIGLEDSFGSLQILLPGWWVRFGECQVSCDASIGANDQTSRWYEEQDPCNHSYDADVPHPSTIRHAMTNVMHHACSSNGGRNISSKRIGYGRVEGLENAITQLRATLPNWWYSVDISHHSTEVTIAPTNHADAHHLARSGNEFDDGFKAQDERLGAAELMTMTVKAAMDRIEGKRRI